MEEEKQNKKKVFPLPPAAVPVKGGMVRIKMLPNRAAAGVTVDANGFANVPANEAERLIKLGYAVEAKE